MGVHEISANITGKWHDNDNMEYMIFFTIQLANNKSEPMKLSGEIEW